MFKKFLSILLVLCMVCAFVPASIASAAEQENKDVKIVYSLETSDIAINTKLNTVTDYSQTGGFWKYGSASPDSATFNDGSSYASWATTNVAATSAAFYGAMQIVCREKSWYALKFYVPAAGTYDVTLNSQNNNTAKAGCHFAYTILPGRKTDSEITAVMNNVVWNADTSTLSGDALGHINCDNSDGVKSWTSGSSYTFEEAGEYFLVVKNVVHGTGSSSASSVNNHYIYIQNFILQEGEGTVSLPMGTTSLTKTEFADASETATALTSDLLGSADGAEYTAGTVTYASSDASVVSVSGTTIRPVGDGTAEVYAIVDGYPLPGVEVTVDLPDAPNKDVKIVYSLETSNVATNTKLNTVTDYSQTGGFWKYGSASPDSATFNDGSSYASWATTNVAATSAAFYGAMQIVCREKSWYALKFYVPAAGTYDVTLNSQNNNTAKAGCHFAYTILPGRKTDSEITAVMNNVVWNADTSTLSGDALGHINCDNSDGVKSWTSGSSYTFEEAGEYFLVVKNVVHGTGSSSASSVNNHYIYIQNFILQEGEGTVSLPMGTTSLTKTEFADASETATALTSDLLGSADGAEYTAGTVTYASSDTSVVSVSGTTIRPVGDGRAEVYAVVDGYPLPGVTVTAKKYADAPNTSSLFVSSNDTDVVANSALSVTIGSADAVSGGLVSSVARGKSVTVSAPEVSGNYRFKHWLGTAGIASFDAKYTFDMYTNKALLAVYEEIPAEGKATVTFYKPNKEVVASKVVDKETTFGAVKPATVPSLIGFEEFIGWFLGEDKEAEDSYVIENDTEVVALFDGEVPVSGITVDGSPVGDMSYGEAETVTSHNASFSYWKRGDKIVSYNKSYTFYAWQNNASITSVNNGAVEAEPVAVLDEFGDGYMLEYEIPEGCTRLEVGIIFGDRASISVDSCFAKAVSQKTDTRGFFTVSADDDLTVAKGYVIYRDLQGAVKVVYSK